MKLKPKRLRVLPNPWGVHPVVFGKKGSKKSETATVDSRGRPCGVCPVDPMKDSGDPGRLVGAHHDAEMIGDAPNKGEFRHHRQDTGYTFLGCSNRETKPFQLADELAAKEPVDLIYTEYYLERIRDGSLIAADDRTASVAGVEFIEPKKLIPLLAKAAADCFNNHFEDGVDAYAELCSERAETASEKDKLAAFDAAAQKATDETVAKSQEKAR